MAERINKLAGRMARNSIRLVVGAGFLLTGAQWARATPPARVNYAPQAHVVRVERSFIAPKTFPRRGAGVRASQTPDATRGGTEQFDIHWYANPPGIPPGVVLLLESVQERSATIKNHSYRLDKKTEGHIRSTIKIPPSEIRQAGRVRQWRLRVIWRGRLLASQASANWEGSSDSP